MAVNDQDALRDDTLSNRVERILTLFPANTKKVYNFSKIIIKRIITPEECGMIPLKEKDYIHPKQKVAVKYNYWDYVCSHIFDQPIPNWFCKWWTSYGPSAKILPEPYKKLYSEWEDISPKIISLQHDNILFEGISIMYFFIKFYIPWIMKLSIEVKNTSEGFPCLQRTFYTKFWRKLIQKDPEGKIHGQEILDLINDKINKYLDAAKSETQVTDNTSPFKQITRKLHMKKGLISKSEAIAMYMEEVKKDIIKNLGIDIKDDVSMVSSDHTNDGEHIVSFHDKVDNVICMMNSKSKGKKKVAHSSIQPPPKIGDFKLKDFSNLEVFLERKFKGGSLKPIKVDNFSEGETNYKNEFSDDINKISEKYARKPVQRMYYYPRPTPQDVLMEEHEHILTNSYNGKEIYEWNIDGYTDRQIYTTVHRMLMYSTICKTNKNSDKTIADMITTGFTGQLKVMELQECNNTHWKSKFIDGLPSLFAERVRKTLRGENHSINYDDYTYGKLITA
ncbi:hypothetical protein H5410_004762 [Solanum commersonii]|uniref:DUF7746 domain-containing protein n=1 Tax=Solanum commersonii TaxID=4109 RepID=A0A9J6A589_SOLCO|nr:hypothetical protein H5410_004762 [Solanum commersonii]